MQCPYHGWEYGADGHVLRIPSLGDDISIPGRARVDSYPVEERYGYVWVFLGNLPENERPELPDLLPEYGDEDNWRMTRNQRDWNVNWARLKENLADSSHLYLVHSFGKHLPEQTEVFIVEETDWGIDPETGVITARVPTGETTIELRWVGLPQQRTGLWLSVAGCLIWIGIVAKGSRDRRTSTQRRNAPRPPS